VEQVSENLSGDLDRILDGHEVQHQKEHPRLPRGAIDEEKLMSLIAAARAVNEHDLADAFEVANGCALRGGGISRLKYEDVDFEAGVVVAQRKDRALVKARLGNTEEHPIVTMGAELTLRRRCKGLGAGDYLWPAWKAEKANHFIAEHSKKMRWTQRHKWDGMHCHRHGAAVNAKRAALESVKIVGGWRTAASAIHYSRIAR